jgi:RNA polymerase sigma factor (sigma-70 family)
MSERYTDWLDVLARLEAGDRAALSQVTRLITGFLQRLRAHDLQTHWGDICSDVLLSLIKTARRGSLRDERAFVSYASVVTRRALLPYLQKHVRSRQATELDSELPADMTRSEDPQLLLDLEAGLKSLDDRERLVIEAIYLEGRTFAETGQTLGMPFGTVKRLQTQGLRQIRAAMLVERPKR